ncbi:hypothetical protein AWJ20_2804 [Sugiyamaella lignohabitans]|uniref:Uncharacterized protein n=1 Tax=Sugiyamaella lignohabitans TaxID=796027 RepID=A0A161HH22_9ASCO|nr:uncharacterized protein AWJ20_2804 [Sugiyamaella lignohabitans]ANB15180.1 hypothetical protein AWJ20_2804 [Sugiyamaella lignohabitans]
MQFDPLPESEEERIRTLQLNDAKILDVLRQTPTPFFTLIYTSSTGEDFDPQAEHRRQRHWDIFADIVRQKRDPRNRALWKQHQERAKKELSDEPVSALPPRAEFMRQKEREKSTTALSVSTQSYQTKSNWVYDKIMNIDWERLDNLFNTDIIVGIVLTNAAILCIYFGFKAISAIFAFAFQAQ